MALSRRSLLLAGAAVAGGGLVLTWLRPDPRRAPLPGSVPGAFEPNAWLQVTPGGQIILQIDKAELGQGVITGYVTLLAEELDVPPGAITHQLAPIHPLFQDPVQLTGESRSMRSRWLPIRETGARARQMLVAAAAARWQVDPAGLRTDGQGRVLDPEQGRHLSYGELAEEATRQPVPAQVVLRAPGDWRWIGTAVPRPDLPAKVTGRAAYGIDTRLPGQLVAVVARPPRLLAHALGHDASAALALPGVVQVVPIPTGIAVLAETFWHAQRGAAAIAARWDDGPLKGTSSASIRTGQARQLDTVEGHRVREEGDVAAALAGAARVVEAEYALPYLAHACMEPMNATVWFRDGGCEAWVPNQGPDIVRQTLCDLSGLKRADVTVHSTYAGGGFGRRATMEFVLEAGAIALHTDRPVKLVWPRADDLQHTLYREATLHRLRGGLDAAGRPTAWHHRLVAASMNRLVFPITTSLVAPEWFPRAAREGINAGAIALFDRLAGSFTARDGAVSMPYAIPGVQVDLLEWNPGVPITIWRSVGFSYTCFAIESFVDELAVAAGQDPLEFRLRHLADHPRQRAVLELVREKSGWGQAAPGRGRGVAIQEAFGTVVAHVAEVSVAPDGAIRVHRVSCAVDCGTAINPDVVRQQMEGGIIFGLTAALLGEIHIEDGAVREANFNEYRLLRLAEAPAIDVHIVPGTADPGGVGEPAVPPVAPAVANAVFAATGQRLRTLPLRLQPPPQAQL